MKKFIIAVRLNDRNELFEFPTQKKLDNFIKELKKMKISYAVNITGGIHNG